MIARRPVPLSFWIIAILFLVWNIIGDVFYIIQSTMDLDSLARTDPYTAGIWRQMPDWAWATYAVAVFGGTLATLLMIARRALAIPLYALSLLAIILQFGRTFLATDIIAVKGVVIACAFPAFIALMGVLQLLYGRAMKRRGLIG